MPRCRFKNSGDSQRYIGLQLEERESDVKQTKSLHELLDSKINQRYKERVVCANIIKNVYVK